MVIELFSRIMDEYFSIKTRASYSELSKEFGLIKNGAVRMEYGSDVTVAGFSPIDDYEFLRNTRLVNDPRITTDKKFLKFDKGERLSIIAHELGHYDFYCNAPSPGCLRRRVLWDLTHYMDRDYFDSLLVGGADIKVLEYLARYMHDDKRRARIKKWNLMKELYADNKAIDSGYGKELLSMLKKAHKKWGSRLADKNIIIKRIKNLESKLEMKE